MNVSHIKGLTWLGSLGLIGLIGWDIYQKVVVDQQDGDQAYEKLRDDVRTQLDSAVAPEDKKEQLVDYDQVKSALIAFDWTGKPPPPPPPPVAPPGPAVEPPPPPVTPVADLVRILWIQEDLADPAGSAIFIDYLLASAVAEQGTRDRFLRIGDHLVSPQQMIRVEKISGTEGVTFAFDDEEREFETLLPKEFDATDIVAVGPGGAVVRAHNRIPRVGETGSNGSGLLSIPGPKPGETIRLGPNRFRTGATDRERIAESYPAMISKLGPKRHRDPSTGKYDGIQITNVPRNSVASRHGLENGDIIKSINGHPVTSPNEALTFARNNQDKYSRWEVLIENKGRERTIVIDN